MNNKQRIRKIATDVRMTFIEKVMPALSKMHSIENKKSLRGCCAYASTMLYNRFINEGFRPKIVEGDGHYFVKCDEFLVDITASQFGQGMVCVKDWKNIQEKINSGNYELSFWKPVQFHDISAMLEYDLDIGRILVSEI